MSLPSLPSSDIASSPRIVTALEDFFIEAIAEATDILQTGSEANKRALIRMVLAEVLKAKKEDTGADAARVHETTRAFIGAAVLGNVGVDDDDDDDEDGDDE